MSILKLSTLGPRDRQGDVGEGELLFAGDTVSIQVRFEGVDPAERDLLEPTILDPGAVGTARGGWQSEDTFAWEVTLLGIGPQTLAFETAAGNFEVVIVTALDAFGLKERLEWRPRS